MNIIFSWEKDKNSDGGYAIYLTPKGTFETWLPSVEIARELHEILKLVYSEGEKNGRAIIRKGDLND